MLRVWIALIFSGALAHAEHLVFTMLTFPTCPVLVTAPEQSKDFGFQSVLFRNDSYKAIESVSLTVTFHAAERENDEIVDSSHVYLDLQPGEEKRLDVFLARIEALMQKAQSENKDLVFVTLFADSAEFADGTRWDMQATPQDPSDQPVSPAVPQ
jgi:hypothetical protein